MGLPRLPGADVGGLFYSGYMFDEGEFAPDLVEGAGRDQNASDAPDVPVVDGSDASVVEAPDVAASEPVDVLDAGSDESRCASGGPCEGPDAGFGEVPLAFDEPWEGRDALDEVVEVAVMRQVFAAQQYVRVDRMRVEALADAALHGLRMTDVVERGIRLELAAALRVTEYAAGVLIGHAEALVRRYPTVLDALAGGRVTKRHAELLADTLDSVEPELRDRILPEAVRLAETEPVGAFRRALRKLVDTVQVVTLPERYEQAVQGRRVWVEPADDAMARLMVYLPAVEAHAVWHRATTIAKRLKARDGEDRTLDQLRADILADLLIDGDTTTLPPEARGIRATVVVTVPALALLDDAQDGQAGDPPVVEGIGPIPLQRARELCGGADGWMRVLTHPETGMVLSVGRDRYRTPASLRKLVRWRADRCMTPGCSMPASRCEIDHNVAWEDGGSTSLDNHAPFCKGHHRVKHHGGWIIRQLPNSGGVIEWTSPAGRRYLVQPERRVPVFTPAPEPEPRSGPNSGDSDPGSDPPF